LHLDDVPQRKNGLLSILGSKTTKVEPELSPVLPASDEKKGELTENGQFTTVSDAEWHHASRALRTASWSAVFFLITTDVLGPYSVPWALSQMGYGPGVALYTIFGALAGYTGWQIWQMFLRLDSTVYPLRSFGDISFRVYGSWARHVTNILQSLQLVLNVGAIIIQNGQGLYQIDSSICYIVCCVIWMFLGMFLGQIRTLQKFGWIANMAVWINVAVMILTMVIVAHNPPNFVASKASNGFGRESLPIKTYAGSPPYAEGFRTGISGLMQAVYSYGGALIFCEFLSEMRKPRDFWKSIIVAESFIFVVYLFFGLFVYSFHGQFVINPAFQGISPHIAQKAGNVLGLITALIAAALYGNIGIKVVYSSIFIEFLHAPPLDSKKGKWLWVGLVPIYWGIAFILAAAIPNFSNFTNFVAALCILQFTYTFPPLLMLGCNIQLHAMQEGEGFDPATGTTTRLDAGWKRWIRGAKKMWYVNLWNLVFCLGALVTAALGMYSSITGLKEAFASGRATSFSCTGPLGSGS
jgi:hypothetical protein